MDCLFALLRLGLGFESSPFDNVFSFSQMKDADWESLKNVAEKQGVSAIAFDGLNELIKQGDESFHKGVSGKWWKIFMLKWSGAVLLLEQSNQQQIAVMNRMANIWSNDGLKVMVMKGQVNGLMYPNPLHRCPGDIDCYLFEGYGKGNELARKAGAEVDESWYKHSCIRYEGETFENHLYFVLTREGKRSKLLQKELEKELRIECWRKYPHSVIMIPPVQWNAMFLTYHACSHFLTEGLRLKQVLDWAMFLKTHQEEVDWLRLYDFCEKHHLLRFVDAVTAICKEYLGVPLTNQLITDDSSYAERVLHSMLYDDDYIYGAGEGKWQSRLHVIKSLFCHKWKYKEVYQQSEWNQLWWYLTGYLFKTEN